MPAASAKKVRKTAESQPVSMPVAPAFAAADVLAWLQANPAFFTEHAAALGTLAQPAKGGNILSLHAMKERRTARRAEQLEVRHKQMVAAARSNAQICVSNWRGWRRLLRMPRSPSLEDCTP